MAPETGPRPSRPYEALCAPNKHNTIRTKNNSIGHPIFLGDLPGRAHRCLTVGFDPSWHADDREIAAPARLASEAIHEICPLFACWSPLVMRATSRSGRDWRIRALSPSTLRADTVVGSSGHRASRHGDNEILRRTLKAWRCHAPAGGPVSFDPSFGPGDPGPQDARFSRASRSVVHFVCGNILEKDKIMANPPMAEPTSPTVAPTPKDDPKQDNKPEAAPAPPETNK